MAGSEVAAPAGAVIAILGSLIAAVGAAVALRDARARRAGLRATGIVVANVYGRGHALAGQPLATAEPGADGPLQFHAREIGYPKVEFATAAGEKVAFTSSSGSRPPSHAVGDAVAVHYDPADPRRAEIVGEGTTLNVFLVLFGLGLAAIGIAIRVFSR